MMNEVLKGIVHIHNTLKDMAVQMMGILVNMTALAKTHMDIVVTIVQLARTRKPMVGGMTVARTKEVTSVQHRTLEITPTIHVPVKMRGVTMNMGEMNTKKYMALDLHMVAMVAQATLSKQVEGIVHMTTQNPRPLRTIQNTAVASMVELNVQTTEVINRRDAPTSMEDLMAGHTMQNTKGVRATTMVQNDVTMGMGGAIERKTHVGQVVQKGTGAEHTELVPTTAE